ncbi:cytochrome c maturation protein CcmE [Methylobacterium sp. 77]|uniref:cytochrome c maturation protein CcmE n=1 Tax=Methylobacterium sp. 77 TaxID=1101192 RepID=UPI00037DF663|nr:cytochrome c maturation protein CcmE [Methylobacterium sp. 77]
MTRKSRRLILIAACGAVLALALGLILSAMSGSIVFFRSPTEVTAQGVAPGTRFRLGGLVKEGSLQRGPDQNIDFAVTDTNATVQVQYRGLLPDLFREGQGIVAEGRLEPGGIFRADTVLAKHDESYMPREVADALKAQGRWQEGGSKGAAAGKPGAPGKESPAGVTTADGETGLGRRSER